jgi:serine phosphatase RsbU (regulator of sigma subunit)
VLKDTDSGELQVKATKVRNERDDLQRVRLSTTILREAMSKGRALLSADAAHDGRFDQSESVANLRIRSLMCAPLVNQEGDALGAIQVDTLDMRQQFLQEDLDVLASVAAQAGMAVENACLHTATMRQRDLERELEFATQVQLGFLPTERPRLDGYEFYDFYEAAYRVGGDFFDYVVLPGGQVAIGLGDVAGKGIPAALLMARLYSSARYELLTKPTVASALSGLNVDVSMGGLGHRFVTLVFAILDPQTHRLTLSNAGHIPPLLRNSRGQVTKIAAEEAGLPLGIDPEIVYGQCEITLEPGDTLVLLTDGVTEAMNPQNEIYGMTRLTKFLETAPADADALGEALVEDVERFSEGRAQRDDICLICFRRLP